MFKASGAPCDLMAENIRLNPGSYSTTAATDSDLYRETAATNGMPARVGHLPDTTAYSTQPTENEWLQRCKWGWSPANKLSSGQSGNLV